MRFDLGRVASELDRAMPPGHANQRVHRVPPRSALVPQADTYQWMERYRGTQGTDRSSRFQPAVWATPFAVGTWRVASWAGLYGHGIEELVVLDPTGVLDMEGMVETNEQGRGADARRYAQWLQRGLVPPPIGVIEMEDGRLRVSDGHRRLAAAKRAGKPVLGWVSWTVPGDGVDLQGRPIMTGLTWELAEQYGWVR